MDIRVVIHSSELRDMYKYKTWIHTIIRVIILGYTYNYMSSYTFIEIL